MEGQYYKAVGLDKEGTKVAVNYVGVHPLIWHDHPKYPEMGFVEVDLTIDMTDLRNILDELQYVIETADGRDMSYLKNLWNKISDFINKTEKTWAS